MVGYNNDLMIGYNSDLVIGYNSDLMIGYNNDHTTFSQYLFSCIAVQPVASARQ